MKLSGFYRKSFEDRREMIFEQMTATEKVTTPYLDEWVGSQMIENYLFNYQLPLGVATNFTINGKNYLIPMVVEEPSVIAAASKGAKMLGNIEVTSSNRFITGQMILHSLSAEDSQKALEENEEAWMSLAKALSQSMVDRGGGPLKIYHQEHQGEHTDYQCFYLDFDPCDAMGANALNTVLEGLGQRIAQDTSGQVLMNILSNHNPQSVTTAKARMPLSKLSSNPLEAIKRAKKIMLASDYAQIDTYRAVTHNKGIMNGVDAVLLATGNDWRAAEAGIHAYAANQGSYRGLSQWRISADEEFLEGEITLPLQLATVGGTLAIHPVAQWSLKLLNISSAEELSYIVAAVALAQNFAALRALVTDGIQKGHMSLQAKSLAIQVGAKGEEIQRLVRELRKNQPFNRATAVELLDKMRKRLDN